jgi:hypothetical protein
MRQSIIQGVQGGCLDNVGRLFIVKLPAVSREGVERVICKDRDKKDLDIMTKYQQPCCHCHQHEKHEGSVWRIVRGQQLSEE